jgi:hypothetical protein
MQKARAASARPDHDDEPVASRPASKTFQFVTANPTSAEERSQNKVLVRSNASNYHWRRVKKDTDVASSRPAARRRTSNHVHPKSSKRTLAPATPQTNESPSTQSEEPPHKTEEEAIEWVTPSPLSSTDPFGASPHSLSALVISGHHDPFETYPSDLKKEFISPVLDQGRSLHNTLGMRLGLTGYQCSASCR